MAVFDRENYFRDLLAKQVGGRTEVPLSFGRADVMTDTMVWEVEPASRYPAGVRQALHYGAMTGLPAAIATYGPDKLAPKVFRHLARLPAPGVEMWWLHERQFIPIKTADEAQALATYADYGRHPIELPQQPCEVTEQDGEVVRSCDNEPVVWVPIRLCKEHRDRLIPSEPPIPGPVGRSSYRDYPDGRWTSATDLRMADDLIHMIERLAVPHLDPDSRDLINAYLIEVRSVLWHGALDQPDYAEAWDDPDADYE